MKRNPNLILPTLAYPLVQWTLITTTAFIPYDIAIKTNLLLYRILNEQIDM